MRDVVMPADAEADDVAPLLQEKGGSERRLGEKMFPLKVKHTFIDVEDNFPDDNDDAGLLELGAGLNRRQVSAPAAPARQISTASSGGEMGGGKSQQRARWSREVTPNIEDGWPGEFMEEEDEEEAAVPQQQRQLSDNGTEGKRGSKNRKGRDHRLGRLADDAEAEEPMRIQTASADL